MGNRTYTDYEKALLSIVKAFEAEDYDTYDKRIERASIRFKRPEWQVEDDATDVRILGIDGN